MCRQLDFSSVVLTALALVVAPGCTCAGEDSQGRDGGPSRSDSSIVRIDECGNGIDDDMNGRVDDGCQCGQGDTQSCFLGAHANRGVGACVDGTQTCATTGEFGDWGAAPCEGATAPAVEQCDGADRDCDGAIDENCPCTVGEIRACGGNFTISPCRPGTQTCGESGTWGGCDGAIGPTAELCEDGIDNDCDGTEDEGCCDSPSDEVCDGVDNDCNGHIDESVCEACRCAYWGSRNAVATLPNARWAPLTAHDGDGVIGFLLGGDVMIGDDVPNAPVWFGRRRADGTAVGTDRMIAPASTKVLGIAWSGTRWIIVWRSLDTSARIAALASDGTTLVGPVSIESADVTGVAAIGDETYLMIDTAAVGDLSVVQRLDASLTRMGAPITFTHLTRGRHIAVAGNAISVLGVGAPNTTAYHALIRGGTLVSENDLQRVSSIDASYYPLEGMRVAADDTRILACWQGIGDVIWCRGLATTDAHPLGPAFVVTPDEPNAWDVVRASCSMVVVTGNTPSGLSGSIGSYAAHHIDDVGNVDSKTVDRQWLQPNSSMRVYATHDGRLFRVADMSTNFMVFPPTSTDATWASITTWWCREPPPPASDCQEVARTACNFACDMSFCPHFSECALLRGGGGVAGSRAMICAQLEVAMCGLPSRPSTIDLPRCQEVLAEAQICTGEASRGTWVVPADCFIPE